MVLTVKSTRQAKILELIAARDIETQNQLMEALLEQGVKSTQATLSRDIKELRLVKELSPHGSYRYVTASRDELSDYDARLKKIFRESVTSYAVAQNFIVIKTLPGLASAACSTMDSMNIPHLVGTLAGDDTAFLAMRDNESAEHLCREIEAML
jgi:transcriptional regulator of arginine metabolism